MIITGKSERTGSRLLQDIRRHFGKSKGQLVTVAEFAEYTGILEQTVMDMSLLDYFNNVLYIKQNNYICLLY